MRISRSMLVVLVLPLLVTCTGTEEVGTEEVGTEEVGTEEVEQEDGVATDSATIAVSARVEGGRIVIEKDEAHHATAVVGPGDEVVWVCDPCPDGAEFTVEGLHLVANLEEVVERLSSEPPPSAPAAPQAGPEEVGGEPESERASGARGDYIAGKVSLQWEDGQLVVARDLLVPIGPPAWAPPAGFKPKGQPIRSRRLPAGVPHAVWKFTWKVRYQGSEDVWDPHIYTHPEL